MILCILFYTGALPVVATNLLNKPIGFGTASTMTKPSGLTRSFSFDGSSNKTSSFGSSSGKRGRIL